MPDQNKTKATREITEAVAVWLNDRGFRPIETELPVGTKWVADLACCGSLTRTEAVRAKLLRRAPEWNRDNRDARDKWHNDFLAIPGILSCVVEVKTSVGDFRSDDKWKRPPVAHLQYVAIPNALQTKVKTTQGWGILLKTDGGMRCATVPAVNQMDDKAIASFLFQLLLRRDSFTRNARFRQFAREARSEENAYTNRRRLSEVINAVLQVVEGEATADVAFPVKHYPSRHFVERLNRLRVAELDDAGTTWEGE